jgi:hypothetical protein
MNDKTTTSPTPTGPVLEPVSDLDLDALITTWDANPHMLGFRDAVLSCLRELKQRRAPSPAALGEGEVELRDALIEAFYDADDKRVQDYHEFADIALGIFRSALTDMREERERLREALGSIRDLYFPAVPSGAWLTDAEFREEVCRITERVIKT